MRTRESEEDEKPEERKRHEEQREHQQQEEQQEKEEIARDHEIGGEIGTPAHQTKHGKQEREVSKSPAGSGIHRIAEPRREGERQRRRRRGEVR